MLTFYLSFVINQENDDYFVKIYNKYKRSMFNIAMHHLKDYHYAENALQIAFIGIARNMDTIKSLDKEKEEIYILKCAKTAARLVRREEMSHYNKEFELEDQYKEIQSSDSVIEECIENELLRKIIAFIKTLPEYKDVLTLRFLYNLKFNEISEVLHIPESTVKYKFYRGQQLIIDKFKEERYD